MIELITLRQLASIIMIRMEVIVLYALFVLAVTSILYMTMFGIVAFSAKYLARMFQAKLPRGITNFLMIVVLALLFIFSVSLAMQIVPVLLKTIYGTRQIVPGQSFFREFSED